MYKLGRKIVDSWFHKWKNPHPSSKYGLLRVAVIGVRAGEYGRKSFSWKENNEAIRDLRIGSFDPYICKVFNLNEAKKLFLSEEVVLVKWLSVLTNYLLDEIEGMPSYDRHKTRPRIN